MKNNQLTNFNNLLNLILVFSIFIAIIGLLNDIVNTKYEGGVDLVNRVIGARLLTRGMNPYFYKWNPNDNIDLLDPVDSPKKIMNRVTVPPTILILHSSMGTLSYRFQRQLWLGIQWSLLLLTIFLLSKMTSSRIALKVIWIFGLLFISGSYFWRLHIEVGQIYILYTFLVTLSLWFYMKGTKYDILVGSLLGLLILLRSPYLLIMLPFLIFRNWRILVSSAISFITLFLISLPLAGLKTWRAYYDAMRMHGLYHIELIDAGKVKIDQSLYIIDKVMEWLRSYSWTFNSPLYDSSLQGFLYQFLKVTLTSNHLLILLVITILATSLFILKNYSKLNDRKLIFMSGLLLVFLSEFFIPASRNPYNNVIWLPVFVLLLYSFNIRLLLFNPLSALLIFGLVLSNSFNLSENMNIFGDFALMLFCLLSFYIHVNADRMANLLVPRSRNSAVQYLNIFYLIFGSVKEIIQLLNIDDYLNRSSENQYKKDKVLQ
ncbi:DUF2029 domain-containing protein [candidate division KSB1 bacterium]|nr:DUF2029 domain-containing protein [candidate division KSB1 bacterium]